MRKQFMRRALALAEEAAKLGEVPVGCVVAKGDLIVGEGFNRRETGKNALYHAELTAIDNACKTLSGWRLWECQLYVTLEPCPMCAGAIINARLTDVVFGAYDSKNGACGSVANLFNMGFTNKPNVQGGVLETECAALLRQFFTDLRNARKLTDS